MHEDIGLNFAAALRSFLRQDPDIIMVGEIRDFETAEIAVKAALTGHMVLSTLHTNDAPSTINRLLNMGIEPFLVTASVNLILAQRLARRICANCKQPIETCRVALLDIPRSSPEIGTFQVYKGQGCATCSETGYKGRVAFYEVMDVQGRAQASSSSTARRPPRSRPRPSARHADAAQRRCATHRGHHDPREVSRATAAETPALVIDGGRSPRTPPAALPRRRGGASVEANLHQLLKAMIEKGASDLHITTGSPPQLRIDGDLVPLKTPPLTPVETKQLCYSILTDAQKHKFEETSELDLSFGVKNLSRFRANLFMQRGAVAGAFRVIPYKILSFNELGLPPVINELAKRPRGLVLVTGPTGSGKSTTLASIIDKINNERHEHILTIEDPIEYLHPHKGCMVNQREVGPTPTTSRRRSSTSFARTPTSSSSARCATSRRSRRRSSSPRPVTSRSARCTPTLAVQTINRIIDVFPPYQQPQVRAQLSALSSRVS
jgi:twitching motility protein PilT